MCLPEPDGRPELPSVSAMLRTVVRSLMGSPEHRAHMLNPTHRRVSMGLAWDDHAVRAVHHFEGDYVRYERLPRIEGGVLVMSGTVGNGAAFADSRDLDVLVLYDPPPAPLTTAQVSRTDCYFRGVGIAGLVPPGQADAVPAGEVARPYVTHHCPDPHGVDPELAPPTNEQQVRDLWQRAHASSLAPREIREALIMVLAADVSGDRW